MTDSASTAKPSGVAAPEKKIKGEVKWDSTNIEEKGGLGVGAIVGIIIGVIVVILLIVGVILYMRRKGDHKSLA